MSVKIGKAKPQGGGKRNFFKLKDGDNVFMVLPPLGDLADDGVWKAYHAVHYGYKDSQGKLKPFLSTEVINYKTKMVEVPDAALDRVKKIETQYKEAVANRNIEEAKRLKSIKERYNLDKKFYVNAMSLNGELGLLKVPYKSMKVLEAEIDRQKAAGIDVMDVDNGRFMVFRRSGTGLDTAHQVLTYKEKMKIEGVGEVEKEKVATLDESTLKRLATEVSLNLKTIFKSITADQVALIVEADMAGDFSVIDSILGGSAAVEEDAEEVDDIPENKPAPKAAAATTTKTAAPTETKAKTEVKVAKTAPTAAVADVSAMSDEEFLAMMK